MIWHPEFSRWSPAIDDAFTCRDFFQAHGSPAPWPVRLEGQITRLANTISGRKYEYFAHIHVDSLVVGADPITGLIAALTRAARGESTLLVPSFPQHVKDGFLECSTQRYALCDGPAASFLHERFIHSTRCNVGDQLDHIARLAEEVPSADGSEQPPICVLDPDYGVQASSSSVDTFNGDPIAWLSTSAGLPEAIRQLWCKVYERAPVLQPSPGKAPKRGYAQHNTPAHYVLLTACSILQTSVLAPNTVEPTVKSLRQIGDGARPTARYPQFTSAMRLVDFIEACASDARELTELQETITEMEATEA